MFFIPYGTREHEPRRSFPFVTVAIVAINLVVFAYQVYLVGTYGESGLSEFINKYAIVPADILTYGWLQAGLVTSMFLHAGLLHFLGNMLYLLPFGDNVEDRMGHFKYLVFYLLCGLAAVVVHILFNRTSPVPLLGASGAIAGVLGGYLILHPHGTVKGFFVVIILFFRVDLPAILFIGYWFLIQIFSSAASLTGGTAAGGGVAFLAHVGGFVAGLLLAPLFAGRRPGGPVPISRLGGDT
jgi:membrane associated rhomboid family serine protease